MKRLCLEISLTDLYDLFLFTEKVIFYTSLECCIRGILYELFVLFIYLLNCWIKFVNPNVKRVQL